MTGRYAGFGRGEQTPIMVNDMAFPVRVLGPGCRVVIWMHGCSLQCPGCMSPHTWTETGGSHLLVGSVVDAVRGLLTEGVDGITVSGGEPTEQPEALIALLSLLRGLPGGRDRDLFVYTGRSLAWCKTGGRQLFADADAVMAGRYDRRRTADKPLRGSDNQTLWLPTELGATRFKSDQLPSARAVELHDRDGRLLLVGIPGPGDLAMVAGSARSRGLTAQTHMGEG